MSAYVIIDIKVLDTDSYSDYVRKVPPIIEKYGGRYLVRGGEITTLSGGWHPERVILLEFDSAEQVNNWLTSPEYAEITSLREKSTESKAILI